MTKFKVGDKVRILDASKIRLSDLFGYKDGDITTLERSALGGIGLADTHVGNALYLTASEYQYIELVSAKPTKNQRITTLEQNVVSLESEVAELKAKVEALEALPKPTEVAEMFALAQLEAQSKANERSPKRVKPKSPNEQRKAIIAEAKAFVEKYSGIVRAGTTPYTTESGGTIVKLFVNEKKRTVTAIPHLVHVNFDDVDCKKFAKCAPDDVFNADIGKAIALGRALGLDVSRFEQAVKPTEVVVGTKVDDEGVVQTVSELIETPYKTLFTGEKVSGQAFNTKESVGWLTQSQVTIIDDTEAVY